METKRGKRRLIEDDSEEEEEERIEMETTETKRGRFIIERVGEEDDYSKFLPSEIKTEIISRLPGDSAIGCRLICKPWRSLIDHPSFVDTHTRRVISSSSPSKPKKFGNYLIPSSSTSSSGVFFCAQQEYAKLHLQFVEYNDNVDGVVLELKPSKPITDHHRFPFYHEWGILLMSSCNGLVFMGSTKPNYVNDMFICNPFTREYVNLRTADDQDQRRRQRLESKGYMAYGFGYLPSTNEYKVVRLYYDDLDLDSEGERNANVSVYTLGSGKWRNKGEIPYWVYTQLQPGLLANGSIHWFTHTKKNGIVSFDLADEEFRVLLPLPPRPPANHVDRLGVLGGCLCVTRSDKTLCESPKDIWILNVHTKEVGKEEFSWNKRFSIPWKGTSFRAEPYVILKSGKILLCGGTGLICYDPKTGAFNEDRQSIFCDPRLRVIPYTKSFVSLKALGEENAKCFEGFVSLAPTQPPQP